MIAVTQEFSSWLEESKDTLLRAKKQRILNHQAVKAQIADHKDQKMRWESQVSNAEFTEDQKMEINNLKKTIKKLNIAADEKARTVYEQNENLQRNEVLTKLKANDVDAKESEVNKKQEKLEKGLRYFEDCLGLKVKRFPDTHLKFIFTCIDEERPDKEYSFDLTVKGTPGTYIVSNCFPSVERLNDHVTVLNDTNNMKMFLCQMRKEFKSL